MSYFIRNTRRLMNIVLDEQKTPVQLKMWMVDGWCLHVPECVHNERMANANEVVDIVDDHDKIALMGKAIFSVGWLTNIMSAMYIHQRILNKDFHSNGPVDSYYASAQEVVVFTIFAIASHFRFCIFRSFSLVHTLN